MIDKESRGVGTNADTISYKQAPQHSPREIERTSRAIAGSSCLTAALSLLRRASSTSTHGLQEWSVETFLRTLLHQKRRNKFWLMTMQFSFYFRTAEGKPWTTAPCTSLPLVCRIMPFIRHTLKNIRSLRHRLPRQGHVNTK